MTIVCGDSHTSTHGAFGALAFGIGTSEVEHVMATQTLPQYKPKNLPHQCRRQAPTRRHRQRHRPPHHRPDRHRTAPPATSVEYAGSAIRALSMEGRMTICNMSIEAGARAGMIAPDETTFAYLKGRRFSPQGAAWDEAVAHWPTLATDPGATFDRELHIDAIDHHSDRHLGHLARHGHHESSPPFPILDPPATEADRKAFERALEYMDLKPGTPIERDHRSTASSSAPAPTPASKTFALPPRSFAAITSPPRPRDGRPRLPSRQSARPKKKASTRSSQKPASSGANPAAACVSA